MVIRGTRVRIRKVAWILALALPMTVLHGTVYVASSTDGEPASAGKGKEAILVGEWVGAKLLCRKEQNSAVRCGKPESFTVTFREDGTGTSPDDKFPNAFTYQWETPSELVLTPQPEGDELRLFQLELEGGFLSFQAYIYLPVPEGAPSEKVRYIHYIFDVSRTD